MTKQEQIDEMAKIIDDRLTEENCLLGIMYKGIGHWIAQKLVEHYQPKLPEDSVVLSMANNDKTIEQANKKIVRQFYNKIQKMLDETRQVIEEPCNGRQNAGYCVADVDNGLKELAKQFGVELKE